METKDCILTRRSVRKFTDRKVEHRLVEQIISLAAYAPSWKNTQISRYIAIEDPKVLEEICRTYAPFNARIIGNCPLLIAQTFVKGRSGFERDGSFSTDREAGLAVLRLRHCLPDPMPGRPRPGAGHRGHGRL